MIKKNINIILNTCAGIRQDDTVLILSDDKTAEIGKLFYNLSKMSIESVEHVIVESSNIPGANEPTNEIAASMLNKTLIISLTSTSIAHTQARYNASKSGARFLSLPDYSLKLLERDSLDTDYFSAKIKVDYFAKLLTRTNKVYVETDKGTSLELIVKDRDGNSCPCIVRNAGEIGSPPDIEANIAIVEDSTNGIFVVDGSIACSEFGLLEEIIILKIKNGRIVSFEGKNSEKLEHLFSHHSELAKVPAELGFGFNEKANLCGIMLEDEGCLGTLHIGFGSNSTIGGKNKVPFHLDMIIKEPDVFFDNVKILDKGKYNI